MTMTSRNRSGCRGNRYAYAAWIFAVVVFLCVFAFSEARDTEELDANECMELEVYSGRFVPCCVLKQFEGEAYCEMPDGNALWLDIGGDGMG